MRKLFFVFILMLAASAGVQAQNPTAVTGTLVDPNGVPFYPATVTACLSPFTRDPVANGQHINSQAGSGGNYCPGNVSTSPNGAFSMNIYPNAAITPGATQYQFTVSTSGAAPPAGKGAQTYNVTVTISGSSQDVSASLNAASTALLVVPGSSHGVGAPSGSCLSGTIYTNDSNGNLYSCNAGTWTLINAATGFSGAIALGQYAFGSAASTFSGTTNRIDCSAQAGADLGAKINACIAALSGSAGIADATNIKGAQTLSTAVSIPAGVSLLFGSNVQISQSGAITLSAAKAAIWCPVDESAVFTKAGNIDQITLNAAQTNVFNCTLIGVGGSFTGSGIVATVSAGVNSLIVNNTVSGEASNAVKAASGFVQSNNLQGTSANPTLLINGNNVVAMSNAVTATASDSIRVQGNSDTLQSNLVFLNPVASATGFCGINFNADQINNTSITNVVSLTDTTNSANITYGICDTTTGTHNLGMLFEGDTVFGNFSGTYTAFGFFMNNTAALNTNWSLTVRDLRCVHLGAGLPDACVKRTDPQNQISFYEDIQQEDDALDAGTGSTNDKWVLHNQNLTATTLPSPAGSGSEVYSTNGMGAGACKLTNIGGAWSCQHQAAWTFVQSQFINGTTVTFPNHFVPGDTLVALIVCNQVGSPTTTVSDGASNTYASVVAPISNAGVTAWYQAWYATGASTPGTITIGSCTGPTGFIAEYAGIKFTASPSDGGNGGTGNSTTPASGNITVTPNDLLVGYAQSAGGSPSAGTGCVLRQQAFGNSGIVDCLATTTAQPVNFATAAGAWTAIGAGFKTAP